MMDFSFSSVEHLFSQKLLHVMGRVKVSQRPKVY